MPMFRYKTSLETRRTRDQKAKEHLQIAVENYKAAGYFWKKGISEGIPISQEYVDKVLKPFWSSAQEEIRKAEKLLK